jgi:hypothetical protein
LVIDAPPRNIRRLSLVVVVASVVIGAGVIGYYYSVYEPAYACVYSPGNGFYLHIVNSTNGSPLAGLPVEGELVKSCLPGSVTIQVLGSWNFRTNATGFVSVPPSDLSGEAFWFTIASGGSTYQVKSPVCGEGVTFVELGFPSGAISGRLVSGTNEVTVSQGANGHQTTTGCSSMAWQGNATVT